MKRNILLTVMMCIFSLIVLFGIFYLNSPDVFLHTNRSGEVSHHISKVRYPVFRTEMASTYKVAGKAISNRPDIYITEKKVEINDFGTFDAKISSGDEVSVGDTLYILAGEEYRSDVNGRIVNIVEGNGGVIITLLNYDKLFAIVKVDASKLSKINYNTPVTLVVNGVKCSSSVKYIDYEISEKTVNVWLNIPVRALPGSDIEAIFTLEVRANSLIASADAVYNDGLGYYAFLELPGDSSRKVEISVGEYFVVEENGHEFAYYEVISGLEEGDVIVVETIDSNVANEDLLK